MGRMGQYDWVSGHLIQFCWRIASTWWGGTPSRLCVSVCGKGGAFVFFFRNLGGTVWPPLHDTHTLTAHPCACPCVSPSQIIGVTLCFMGSVISNMGVNFQKLCHMKLEVKAKQAAALAASSGTDAPTAPKIVLQPLWIGGLVCIALGSVMDLLSFGFASLSLLAPLGAMVRWGSACAQRRPRSPPVPET